MQTIFETLFDIVYLVTVITLGIRMIRGSKGKKQFFLNKLQSTYLCSLESGCAPGRFMPDAAKRMGQHQCAAQLGNLPQHSLYDPWCCHCHSVFYKCKNSTGQLFSLAMAHGSPELRLLSSCGTVC